MLLTNPRNTQLKEFPNPEGPVHLRTSSSSFSKIIDTIDEFDVGFMLLDISGRPVFINRKGCQIISKHNDCEEFELSTNCSTASTFDDVPSAHQGSYQRGSPDNVCRIEQFLNVEEALLATSSDLSSPDSHPLRSLRQILYENLKMGVKRFNHGNGLNTIVNKGTESEIQVHINEVEQESTLFLLILVDGAVNWSNPKVKDFWQRSIGNCSQGIRNVFVMKEAIKDLFPVASRTELINSMLFSIQRLKLEVETNFRFWKKGYAQLSAMTQRMDLRRVIQNTVSLFSEQVSYKELDVEIAFDDDDMVISNDERFIRIIFFNLFSNAVRMSTRGDKIVVSVGRNEPNGSIRIQVEDSIGAISETIQKRVFDPFFQMPWEGNVIRDTPYDPKGLSTCHKLSFLVGNGLSVQSSGSRQNKFYFSVKTFEQ